MSPPPSSPNSTTFLEQTVALLSSVATYMRLPAIASTVSMRSLPAVLVSANHFLYQGVAAVLTSLLYFKQK